MCSRSCPAWWESESRQQKTSLRRNARKVIALSSPEQILFQTGFNEDWMGNVDCAFRCNVKEQLRIDTVPDLPWNLANKQRFAFWAWSTSCNKQQLKWLNSKVNTTTIMQYSGNLARVKFSLITIQRRSLNHEWHVTVEFLHWVNYLHVHARL